MPPPRCNRHLLALLALGTALLAVPTAGAGTYVERAVAMLGSDPIYVDPAAKPSLAAGQVAQLRQAIGAAGAGPVYVAVLPAAARNEAGGDAGALLQRLYRGVGQQGTYAVVAGGQFRAGSNAPGFHKGEVPKLATDAYAAHHADGLATTLLDFVHRLGRARGGGSGTTSSGGRSFLPFLLVLAAVGGVIWFVRRRRRTSRSQNELAQVVPTVREDLLALASDIDRVKADAAHPESHAELERALQLYDGAARGLDRARRPEDLTPVSAALEEGRYLMARAQARDAGEPLPERTPPCFFDPRHGPSAREVEWTPPGGSPRSVPVCEADAQQVERGLEPAARELTIDGRTMPYYAAPAYYGPYFGGFGLGGFFPGLLIGEMLGGGLYGGGYYGDGGYDGGGSGDGGDFGGGGGGGDFGGDGGGGGDF